MNSPQIAFGLERAAWPAMLVNDRGLILRANAAAITAFGPVVSGDSPSLSAIWSGENGVPAMDFLKHWEQTPMPVVMLKFRSSNGAAMNFTTSISTFSKDNQKWFVLQLVLATAPTPTANLGSPLGIPPTAATPEPAHTPPPAHAPSPNVPPLKMVAAHPVQPPVHATPPPHPNEHKTPDTSPANDKPVSDTNGQMLKQKLDCALQLARTVSLDFNNALTSILGHASFLLSKSEAGHPWRHSLMEIEKSASHAAEVANELAIFSRQDKETRRVPPGNLNLVLGRCIDFFRNSHGQKVVWNLQLEKNLNVSRFDEAKIQQAFTKVMENAVEAISSNGQITVQCRNLELTESTHDGNVRLAPGLYICAEISDNGPGIPPEILPRIFEPFFTTKKNGNHRGLGLALVYGIVTNHGGGVAVSSQPGNGASVRIYLPAENQRVNDSADTSEDDLHGTGKVLVVDDEDFLLSMTETILTEYGYEVLTAGNGAKALAILAREEGDVNLVVTDLVMPGMGGRELIERIKQIAPGTKVLCMSGCVPPADQQIGGDYLRKPFTSEELLSKVKHSITATNALTAK
ncbi:MAG TPA: ATP-binding protein [Verrucomicrobiae bacterium]|jgi:nitrogen-specific signal transduction histidine kinase/ActR/RegA family two-component response regulator